MAVTLAIITFVLLLHIDGKIAKPTSCAGNICYTIFKEKFDFGMAQKACRKDKTDLTSIQSALANEALRDLLLGVTGDFWIGLQKPAAKCSDISSTLRGYEWSKRDKSTQFTNWKSNISVCSERCVSVSSDLKWSERPCEDRASGFICEKMYITCASGSHQNTDGSQTCRVENADCEHQNKSAKLKPACICSNPTSKNTTSLCRCKDGYKMTGGKCQDVDECAEYPCEHECSNIPGSYICKCRNGFIPMKNDRRKCEQHCDKNECAAACNNKTGMLPQCTCPPGYILDSSEEPKCILFDNADSPMHFSTLDDMSTPYFTQDVRSSSPLVTLKPNSLAVLLFVVVATVFF